MEIVFIVLAIFACILLFSVAIFIHEFGHFLAARLLGMKVERFSIGFGPALWKKTIGDVEYRFSAIPFGGYVALPQLDPAGTDKLQGGVAQGASLPVIPAWKRIVVAFAGPFGNIVLAIVLALFLAAIPTAHFGRTPPVVGAVQPKGHAARAGLEEGDRILAVDGHAVADWNDVATAVALSGGRKVPVTIRRAQTNATLSLTASYSQTLDAYTFDAVPSVRSLIGEVKGEAAQKAGLRRNDLIVSLDGIPVETFAGVRSTLQRLGAGKRTVGVQREGALLSLVIDVPFDEKAGRPLLGVTVSSVESTAAWMPSRNPLAQLKWDAGQIFRVLGGLVTPKESKAVAGALGGPVMIAQVLYRYVRRDVWDALGFLRFLNINLAILNLLPIPVLDGGLILFALFELLFRRPLPRKLVDGLSMGFMWLFLGLMVWLVFRDVGRGQRIRQLENLNEAHEKQVQKEKQAREQFRPAFSLTPEKGNP